MTQLVIFSDISKLAIEALDNQQTIRLDRKFLTTTYGQMKDTLCKVLATSYNHNTGELYLWCYKVGYFSMQFDDVTSTPPNDPASLDSLTDWFVEKLTEALAERGCKVATGSSHQVDLETLKNLRGIQTLVDPPALTKGKVWFGPADSVNKH